MELTSLSDAELVALFRDSVIDEQQELARRLCFIAELDRRKLFGEYASLRAYLVGEFGLDEWVADKRIRVARMSKRFPFILKMIEMGRLNFSLLEIAQACANREGLSDEELGALMQTIAGMSNERARREIACLYPRSLSELPKDRILPLTAELSEVRFIATQDLIEKLEEIRGLLAHSHPGVKLGELIDHLATDYRSRHHPEERARRAKERARERKKRKTRKK